MSHVACRCTVLLSHFWLCREHPSDDRQAESFSEYRAGFNARKCGIESDTLIIDGAGIPKLDIENHEDYTEIKVWDNPEKRNLAPGSFDVVNDLMKKIYY